MNKRRDWRAINRRQNAEADNPASAYRTACGVSFVRGIEKLEVVGGLDDGLEEVPG